MRSRVSLLAALCLVALLLGCIEFERQTVTYSHDSARDTLRIFQDYHGIFGADSANSLSAQETNQLDSVLKGHRTFFFNNWISEIDFHELQTFLDEPRQAQDAEAAKEQNMDPAADEHLRSLVKLILDNVHIENGPFYLDPAGKLSGVQSVTVSNISRLISAGNVVIRDAIKTQAANPDTSAEDKRLYLQSAERQREYVALEGNRITVRFPMTREQYDQGTSSDEAGRQIEELRKQGGYCGFTNKELVVHVGLPGARLTVLSMKFSQRTYSSNLLATIKARGLLKQEFDLRAVSKEFFLNTK